jgi:hypothetical protein
MNAEKLAKLQARPTNSSFVTLIHHVSAFTSASTRRDCRSRHALDRWMGWRGLPVERVADGLR